MRYKRLTRQRDNSRQYIDGNHKFIIYDEYKGLWVVGFTNNRPVFSLAKWKAVRFDDKSKAEQFVSDNIMSFDWAKIGKVRR